MSIIRDDKLLAEFMGRTKCEICRTYHPGGLDPHHIFRRGMGGGSRIDVRINIVAACRDCHNKVHDGKITRDALLVIVARREQMTPAEITENMYELMREGLAAPDGESRLNGTGNRHRPSPGEADSNNLISSMPVHRSGSERSLLSTLETGDTSMHGHLRLNGVAMQEKILIDEKFRDRLDPLIDEEKTILREMILKHGCDPVIAWRVPAGLLLVDGHHRYDICQGEGIPFEIKEMEFENRDAVNEFIDKFHAGRRNMTPQKLAYIRGQKYNKKKKPEGRPKQQESTENSITDDGVTSTAESVAATHGVSKATIERDAVFAKAVDTIVKDAPESKATMLNGDMSKKETVFLSSIPRAKRMELLGKVQHDPDAIQKAMTKTRRKSEPSPVKPEADKRKEAFKALDVIVRFLDMRPGKSDKFRTILESLQKIIQDA